MRTVRKRWTDGEDAILVETMLKANNKAEGYITASKLLNRARAGVVARYAQGRYKVVTKKLNNGSVELTHVDKDNIKEIPTPTIIVKSINARVKERLLDRSTQLNSLLAERATESSDDFVDEHAFMFYSLIMNDIVALVNKIK